MCIKRYPWGGRFTEGNSKSPVAVVTLSEEIDFPKDSVAVYGNMKTENLGVEKVIANTCSNPYIRYLIICSADVRGHKSGESLKCIHKNGIDQNNRVIGASSAVPYIENLPQTAIERFQKQVEVIDLIGVNDVDVINSRIADCLGNNPGSFGEPLIVEQIEREKVVEVLNSSFALHSKIDIDPYGIVSPAGEN